jgi:hypothetical protein
MNSKEKQIISKLLKIAENQQKILSKLAQVSQEDVEGNKTYLKSTWQTAGLNSGITAMKDPYVQYTPGTTDPSGTITGSNYTLTGEIPVNKREQFLNTFKTQIKTQKPDLEGKVSTIFKDPATRQV